ncbi:MAG: sodium:calcium antiporter [Marinoscillum sp.]
MELHHAIILFVLSTVAIAVLGTLLTRTADQLADITGLGEAMFGAIFLGGITSLPGIVTSVVAASNNYPELAISNAIGGIAAQTFFLSIADITYSKVNLEHAAASFMNLMQGVLLICLLALIIMGAYGPEVSFLGFHPVSILIILVYIAGSRMISRAKETPMWSPRITHQTVQDVPDPKNKKLSTGKVALQFTVLSALVAAAGYGVASAGMVLAEETGLSQGFVGTILTAVATSLPELIVSLAAVRQGALTLAVGNIIGGNTFDVLFVSFSDLAYPSGSILHAFTQQQFLIIGATMLMTGILILGMLHREKRGIGGIGWESLLIIVVYLLANALMVFG